MRLQHFTYIALLFSLLLTTSSPSAVDAVPNAKPNLDAVSAPITKPLPLVLFDDKPPSPDETVLFVRQAIARIKEVGSQQAIEEFKNPKGKFVKGQLYIFVCDKSGQMLATIDPTLVGKNVINLQDSSGKYFVREILSIGGSKAGHGWVDYKWVNPTTMRIEKKQTYIEATHGDIYVGSGLYRD